MVTDINETYHFAKYTVIESLCWTSETNVFQLLLNERSLKILITKEHMYILKRG